MRKFLKVLLASASMTVICCVSLAQQKAKPQSGKVSYTTSSRVYIRFEDTSSILAGDTLFINKDSTQVPAIVVEQKSSLSCVGKPIARISLSKGDLVQFQGRIITMEKSNEIVSKPLKKENEKIRGSVSIATYTSASSAEDFSSRNMARVKFRADQIEESNFSFDSYLIYRQNLEASETGLYQGPGLFNIYKFAIRHEKANSHRISLGREVNRRVASLGMVDGINLEKTIGGVHMGGIAGFRPNHQNNKFDSNLFQYGAYLGTSYSGKKSGFETTIGVLEQKNSGAIDRRYVYAQGLANLGHGVNFFSSAELDLYNLNSEGNQSGSRLTNLHVSANLRLQKRVRLSLSYDTRRNIIFYETFQTHLEQLIADDQMRQGIRARVNLKVMKGVNVGFAYGKRYQNNLQNASDNYNAFATIRNAPIIGGTLSGNLNFNQSSYLNSLATTFRHNRYYFRNKINISTYLRSVLYSYNPERDTTIIQQFMGASANYRFGQNMTIRGLVELSLRKAEYKSRINIQLTKRF